MVDILFVDIMENKYLQENESKQRNWNFSLIYSENKLLKQLIITMVKTSTQTGFLKLIIALLKLIFYINMDIINSANDNYFMRLLHIFISEKR